uniref:Transposase, Ptta/En/Spm, plant n=1 Tax=Lactuca sativa TaxID=4236 RepID=A0A9R1XKC7_LACSA|nr:hypothetical protein LSAT_V11C400179990 [Lactuca sativa]
MESDSASDHDEDSKQRVGKEATKLSTFEGLVARTMVPITYDSWLKVSEGVREGLWQYVLFVVDPKSRKQILQSIGKKWRNFKHYLYAKFIKNRSKDPKANLFKPPKDYPFIKKEDWKVFVSHRVTKKWEEKSMKAKNTRAHHKYNHRLSKKGYDGLINDIMQETGKTEEEINRTVLWKKARELKIGGYDADMKTIVDKIDERRLSLLRRAMSVVKGLFSRVEEELIQASTHLYQINVRYTLGKHTHTRTRVYNRTRVYSRTRMYGRT